ncbi:hypothetical protein VB005_00584 [Metarhizium brunneum]
MSPQGPGGPLMHTKGPSTWFILDWDQRHISAVNAQDSEDIAIRYPEKHIDSLGLDPTCVIDGLNLKHGIAHQDIEARIMLIHPKTDILISFNFNHSGRISGIGYGED